MVDSKFVVLLFILGTFLAVDARTHITIDSFCTTQRLNVSLSSETAESLWDWYTMYTQDRDWVADPIANYAAASDVLGGERDMIISHRGMSEGVVTMVADSNLFVASFPQDFEGRVYLQYDGLDSAVEESTVPGVGANAFIPEANGDGQSVDMTSQGCATAISFSVSSGVPYVSMALKAIDANETATEYKLEFTDLSAETPTPLTIALDSSSWTNSELFDWTSVAAFQLYITPLPLSPAFDFSLSALTTIGPDVRGSVTSTERTKSGAHNVKARSVANQVLYIYKLPNTHEPFTTVVSDQSGSFSVMGLDSPANYSVCVANLVDQPHGDSLPYGCVMVELDGVNDAPPLSIALVCEAPTLVPPANAVVSCNEDYTTDRLGVASLMACDGSSTPVTSFTDSVSGECPRILTRTFSDGQSSVRQTITLEDVTPVLITPAQDLTASGTEFNAWRLNQGGAVFDSPCGSSLSFAVSGPDAPCNEQTTVTWTATTQCGGSTSTTATFTAVDAPGPVFIVEPQSTTVECDRTDTTAWTNYLTSFGGATASDSCSAVTLSTSADVNDPPAPSCSSTTSVEFVATNERGVSVTTTVDYTVVDNTPPVITSPARNQTRPCIGSVDNDIFFQNWLNFHAGATATDACTADGDLVWHNDYTPGGSLNQTGCDSTPITVTFTVVDQCGASAVTTASYRLVDREPPTITQPALSRKVSCTEDVFDEFNAFLEDHGGATAQDSCSEVRWSHNARFNSFCNMPQPVTFTARDACGNAASTRANFTVTNSGPPTITVLPSPLIVDGCGNVNQVVSNWLENSGGAQATDECSDVTWSNNFTQLASEREASVVSFTACDGCGLCRSAESTYVILPCASQTPSRNPSPSTVPSIVSSETSTFMPGAEASSLCSFGSFGTPNQPCRACDSNCAGCRGSATNCIACPSSRPVLDNGVCTVPSSSLSVVVNVTSTTIVQDNNAQLTVPLGAFEEGTVLHVATIPDDQAGITDASKEPLRFSPIVSVVALSSNGSSMQPDQPVQLCLATTNEAPADDLCLAFVNEQGYWECADDTLTVNEDGKLCGVTTHFAMFALLESQVVANIPLSSTSRGGTVLNTATPVPVPAPSSVNKPIPVPVSIPFPLPVPEPVTLEFQMEDSSATVGLSILLFVLTAFLSL